MTAATGDPLTLALRDAWKRALARHEAARAAGRDSEDVRAVAEKILALLDAKPVDGPSAAVAVEDLRLRAAIAATIMAEVETIERRERP